MRTCKTIFLPALLLVLTACGVQTDQQGSPIDREIQVEATITGAAQKGPFLLGSQVSIGKLLSNGFVESRFNTKTKDGLGNFQIYAKESGPHLITVKGLHFNEVLNNVSSTELTLTVLYNVSTSSMQKAHVNLLTHLSSQRAITLYTQHGLPVEHAIRQSEVDTINALKTVLPIDELSNFSRYSLYNASLEFADGNAYMVALSAVFYQYIDMLRDEFPNYTFDAILHQRLSTIASDLKDDGLINNDPDTLPKLKLASRTLNPLQIIGNLESYSEQVIGEKLPVADLNLYLDTDGDGIVNTFDDDDDGDGIKDEDDLNPYNPSDRGIVRIHPRGAETYTIEMDENGYDKILGDESDMELRLHQYSANGIIRTIDGGLGQNVILGDNDPNVLDFSNTSLNNIAFINGGFGDDLIVGSVGNDTIIGGLSNDSLYGHDGDDLFLITSENDGFDTISGGLGFDKILGSEIDDNIRFRIFHSQYTVEKIDGGEGLNIISGNSTPNYFDFTNTELANISAIDGGDGWDTIKGSQGNDVIIGGPGVDALYGNAGDDTFLVSGFLDGYDYINGGDGFDTILGTDLDDAIGLTKFQFEYSVELIDGGLGTNIIRGNDESSVLDFSNTELKNIAAIYGNGGWDVIAGSQSDDVIIGGSGNDTLFGKKGDDIFRVNGSGDDFDLISGGDGHDRILGSDQDDRIGLVRLDASYHVEVIDGGLGINTIEGNENHNILDFRYTTLVNITAIRGNNGNDSIYGSSSDDLIDGGPGNDSLNGGPGIDTARYSGNRADFSISLLQGIYTVTDLNSTDGNEGSDRLTSFEFIEFADQTISLP